MSSPSDRLSSTPSPSLSNDLDKPKKNNKAPNAHLLPKTRVLELPDQTEHRAQSLDKHVEGLRYKAAYAANLLADDIITLFRLKGKKDKEYLKGLVWSFGVLFDKASGGASTDVVNVRIPSKLLDNVKAVIAIQVSKKSEPKQINPPELDPYPSANVIESTGSGVVVADTVAPLAGPDIANASSVPRET